MLGIDDLLDDNLIGGLNDSIVGSEIAKWQSNRSTASQKEKTLENLQKQKRRSGV